LLKQNAKKEHPMPETREQVQQEAYMRGQQMKQWHQQQQRVVTDEALTTLAADFAHISLFRANQQVSAVSAHERAGVCERAFLEGYRSEIS
jgi:hypothetical protein